MRVSDGCRAKRSAPTAAVLDQRTVKEESWEVETGPARSLARIDVDDLVRLAGLAADAQAGPFARRPHGVGGYAGRLICRALCQGTVLNYLDGRTGVKDFDVWPFYTVHGDGEFRYRWRGTADLDPSKFGRYSGDWPSFIGRRADSLGRTSCRPMPSR